MKTKAFFQFVNKYIPIFDKQIFVFLFFLLLSTLFWFLNALNKEYNTLISYPVKYVLPIDKLLINQLPDKLQLRVNAFGFTILQHKLTTTVVPLTVNIRDLAQYNMDENDTSTYLLLSKFLLNEIENQLDNEIKIMDISPDTLLFEFSGIIDKKVPVRLDIDLSYQKQFMLSGNISIVPDSVVISGPTTILDTISYVFTEHNDLLKLNSTAQFEVLLRPIENALLRTQKVSVEIPVEQFTEVKYRIPIQTRNTPLDQVLKVFPTEVTASFLVSFSHYNSISEKDFIVVADYKDTELQKKRLKLYIAKSPKNVRLLNIYPRNVEYIIEKK